MNASALIPALMILAAGIPAAAPLADPDPTAVVATVGGEPITAAELRAEMERRGGGLPGQYETPEQRRALLEEMIEFRALVAAARAEGFDRRPDLVAAFERILVARYKQDRLDQRLAAIEVADHEVESFYERHKLEYAKPERYQAAIILIGIPQGASDEQRAEQERKARAALAETRELDPSTKHFGPVAVKYSNDRASRYRGGVIGWLTRGARHESKWAPEVVAALFALERPGEIAPIVRTADALYLVRLVDRQAAEIRSLDALREGFRNQILRAKQERAYREFMGEMRSSLEILVDEPLLDSVESPVSLTTDKRPPALPAR